MLTNLKIDVKDYGFLWLGIFTLIYTIYCFCTEQNLAGCMLSVACILNICFSGIKITYNQKGVQL